MNIESKDIKIIPIEELVSDPKNENIHSEEQIKLLEKVIRVNGFRTPLIVSNRSGFIVSGNGRLQAAKNLGMEKLPVIYQDFENEATELRFRLADNEVARYSSLDKEKFIENLEDLDLSLDEIDFNDFGLIDFEFNQPEAPDYGEKNDEIDTDNFGNDLEHTCPKCGFEFND
jgi:ParB-like chromosome segregation protein Spo0J